MLHQTSELFSDSRTTGVRRNSCRFFKPVLLSNDLGLSSRTSLSLPIPTPTLQTPRTSLYLSPGDKAFNIVAPFSIHSIPLPLGSFTQRPSKKSLMWITLPVLNFDLIVCSTKIVCLLLFRFIFRERNKTTRISEK